MAVACGCGSLSSLSTLRHVGGAVYISSETGFAANRYLLQLGVTCSQKASLIRDATLGRLTPMARMPSTSVARKPCRVRNNRGRELRAGEGRRFRVGWSGEGGRIALVGLLLRFIDTRGGGGDNQINSSWRIRVGLLQGNGCSRASAICSLLLLRVFLRLQAITATAVLLLPNITATTSRLLDSFGGLPVHHYSPSRSPS